MMDVVQKYDFWGTLITIVLSLFFLISCSPETAGERSLHQSVPVYSSLEVELLNLVNDHRISIGMEELQRLEEVSQQAQLHSTHMVKAKEICHHNFGSRLQALKEKVGAQSMGENVGYGYKTPEAFFKAWLSSPHHKKIIEGENTHFGISAEQAEPNIYVTLIFIRK